MISTDVLRSNNSKVTDRVNQDGMRRTNCFYCKVEKYENEMYRKELRSKKQDSLGGDCIIICKDCHKQVGG